MATTVENLSPGADEVKEGGMSTPMQMTETSQSEFADELGKLRATNNSGPQDRRLAAIGIVLVVVGLIVILVAFVQSRGYSNILDQMDALILSVFGLGLVGFGSVVYLRAALTRFLRYWLLRMVYEQRDLAQKR